MSKIIASSKDRYRASASERRLYGGATVTEFYIYRAEDANDASKWKIVRGYGKTPGERKTDAIRRSGLLGSPAPEGPAPSLWGRGTGGQDPSRDRAKSMRKPNRRGTTSLMRGRTLTALSTRRADHVGTHASRDPSQPFKVDKTYETWDEEALQAGETDDKGYDYEDEPMGLREVLRELHVSGPWQYGGVHTRGQQRVMRFSTTDPDVNYRTGEETSHTIHIRGSERAIRRLKDVLESSRKSSNIHMRDAVKRRSHVRHPRSTPKKSRARRPSLAGSHQGIDMRHYSRSSSGDTSYDRDRRKKKRSSLTRRRKAASRRRVSRKRDVGLRDRGWWKQKRRHATAAKAGWAKRKGKKRKSAKSRDVSKTSYDMTTRDRGWWKQPKRHAKAAKAGWSKRKGKKRKSSRDRGAPIMSARTLRDSLRSRDKGWWGDKKRHAHAASMGWHLAARPTWKPKNPKYKWKSKRVGRGTLAQSGGFGSTRGTAARGRAYLRGVVRTENAGHRAKRASTTKKRSKKARDAAYDRDFRKQRSHARRRSYARSRRRGY